MLLCFLLPVCTIFGSEGQLRSHFFLNLRNDCANQPSPTRETTIAHYIVSRRLTRLRVAVGQPGLMANQPHAIKKKKHCIHPLQQSL